MVSISKEGRKNGFQVSRRNSEAITGGSLLISALGNRKKKGEQCSYLKGRDPVGGGERNTLPIMTAGGGNPFLLQSFEKNPPTSFGKEGGRIVHV